MRSFLLFVTLLGAAWAMQPDKAYVYKYHAVTRLGIPDIQKHFSVVGIRGDLIVEQRQNNQNQIAIQIQNLESATNLAHGTGGDRPEYQLQWQKAQGELQMLQEPFLVHLHSNEGKVMEVPKTDKEWMTNIRKSIGQLFNVNPMARQRHLLSRGKFSDEFELNETTIFGHCQSRYNTERIDGGLLPMLSRVQGNAVHHEHCVQGAYNVSRSIEFDHCSDMSLIQLTGLSNRTNAGQSQHRDTETRSSNQYFVICGPQNDMEIHNVSIIGNFKANPFGHDTEKLVSTTNQTMQLYDVQGRKNLNPQNLKDVRTFALEMASPFYPGNHERPWVNFHQMRKENVQYMPEFVATGESYESKKNEFKNTIKNNVVMAAATLVAMPNEKPAVGVYDSKESIVPHSLLQASKLLRSMNYQELQELYKNFDNSNQNKQQEVEKMLFIDILSASGSTPAIRLLLDKMNDQSNNNITDVRAKSIFMTLTNNVNSPEVVQHLVNYMKKVDAQTKPYLAATAYINIASVVRRICTDQHISNYSVPGAIFGSQHCDRDQILNEIIGFLHQRLQSSRHTYEKAVLIEAIGNVGHQNSIPILEEVINGEYGQNASIRVMGVNALLHKKLPENHHVYNEVYRILTEVFMNFNEDLQMRQAAVYVLASWRPHAEFYHNIAELTWRDPTRELGSFIYSFIQSLSRCTEPSIVRHAEMAKSALRKARSYPRNLMRSYSYIWAKALPQNRHSLLFDYARIVANDSSFAREFFTYARNSYGGFEYDTFQISSYAYNADDILYQMISNMNLDKPVPGVKAYQNFYEKIMQQLQFEQGQQNKYQLINVLKLFDHMELFLPFDDEIIQNSGNSIQNVINDLVEGKDLYMVKYLNPAPVEMFIPVDTGFALRYEVSYPIVISVIGRAHLKAQNFNQPRLVDLFKSPLVELNVDKNGKYISEYSSQISALVPWQEEEAYTEVTNTYNVNAPTYANFSMVNGLSHEFANRTLAVQFTPKVEQEYPVVHAHNIPSVGIRDMWHEKNPASGNAKTLNVNINDEPAVKQNDELSKDNTGLNIRLRYQGDFRNPFTLGQIYEIQRNPQLLFELHSMTSRHWDYQIDYNPASSETKHINGSMSMWLPTQFYYMPQQNFTNIENSNRDYTRDSQFGVTARLHLNGTVNRYFEASAGYTFKVDREAEGDTLEDLFRFNYHRSALPPAKTSPYGFCVQNRGRQDLIRNFEEVYNVIKQQGKTPEAKYTGHVLSGEQCNQTDSYLGDVHVALELSEDEKKNIQSDVGQHGRFTPKNPNGPFYTSAEIVIRYENDKVPSNLRELVNKAHWTMEGHLFPYMYFNEEKKNAAGQIKVQMHRIPKQQKINGTVTSPNGTTYFDNAKVPESFYQIVFQSGEGEMSKFCRINDHQVKTFDDTRFDYNDHALDNCWHIAYVNRMHPRRLQVLTRRTAEGGQNRFHVAIASDIHKVSIVATSNEVKVNEQQVEAHNTFKWINDQNNQQFAQVARLDNHMEITVPLNLTVAIHDNEVRIYELPPIKGTGSGMCGDSNGEMVKDMVGPKNCIYRYGLEFSWAWALNFGDKCDAGAWNTAQNRVKQFQQNCPKAYHPHHGRGQKLKSRQLGKASPDELCMDFVYPVRRVQEGVVCVCKNSIGRCQPGCKLTKEVTTFENYKCWTPEDIPPEVKASIRRGYMTYEPPEQPDVTQSMDTTGAFICDPLP